MRCPGLQTLLLYAKSLDTNADCTRILCDNWLEVRFLEPESAQKIVSAVLYLRSSIDKLFKIRLEDRLSAFDEEKEKTDEIEKSILEEPKNYRERARRLEKLLKKKLSEFLDSSVLYSLRRVLPAEMNTMFVKNFSVENPEVDKNINPDLLKQIKQDNAKINEIKGGFRITDYLTYNWFLKIIFI